MKLLIGTNNPGKIIEISSVLDGLPVDIVTPADAGITESPAETGDTFEANALQKARFYHEQSGLPVIADDSGIMVEALADELGIHTRRWGAGPEATDQKWIEYFLDRMATEDNKQAYFMCVLAYIDDAGTEHLFEGRCEGLITKELEAEHLPGLPISACFKPTGYDKVFSALSVEEKNEVSHRGKATQHFCKHIQALLLGS